MSRHRRLGRIAQAQGVAQLGEAGHGGGGWRQHLLQAFPRSRGPDADIMAVHGEQKSLVQKDFRTENHHFRSGNIQKTMEHHHLFMAKSTSHFQKQTVCLPGGKMIQDNHNNGMIPLNHGT